MSRKKNCMYTTSVVRTASSSVTGTRMKKTDVRIMPVLDMKSDLRVDGAATGKGNTMRENVIEIEFVKAVQAAGGVAYKLTSQTANGLPDRLVLFFPAKTIFVELKAPGKMLRPLQRKRRSQLMKLGFPVLCVDRLEQIQPVIRAILDWQPGTPFPEKIGARIPEQRNITLPVVAISQTREVMPDEVHTP